MTQHLAVGRFIRERRLQLGLTQEELAERISQNGTWLNQSDISRIETGRVRLPRPERLDRIADALDVSLGELLASIATVGADGQLLLEDTWLPGLDRDAGPYGPVSIHDFHLEGPGNEQSTVDQIQRACEAMRILLGDTGDDQPGRFESMSAADRRQAAAMLDELGRLALRKATELRGMRGDGDQRSSQSLVDAIVPELDALAASNDGDYFRHLLDSIGQAVIVTAPDGGILFWNRFAEQQFGWKSHEVLGKNVVEVTPSDLSREEAEAIMGRLRAGKSWSGRFQLQRRDKSSFWAFVTDTPVRDMAGNLIAIIGISYQVPDHRSDNDQTDTPRLRAPLSWAARQRVS